MKYAVRYFKAARPVSSHEPKEQHGKLLIRPMSEVRRLYSRHAARFDAKDAPMFIVPAFRLGLVARVLVVPVAEVDVTDGAPFHVERPEVLVAGHEKVVAAA